MQGNPLLSTDSKNKTTIKFNTKAEYKIGKTTYRVTSYFADNGEDLRMKITRLLKQDLDEITVVEFDTVR